MKCDACDKKIDPRKDVRYTTCGRELCSPQCVVRTWIREGDNKL